MKKSNTYLTNGLIRELALICTAGALFGLYRRSVFITSGFAAGAGLLWLTTWLRRESFKGQSVMITGGSRGLGFALARRLAKEGARLTIIARDEDELSKAEGCLRRDFPGTQVLALTLDVTDTSALEEAFQKVQQEYGGLDMLINNAGAITVGPYASMERQDFEAQMELHFYAILESTRLALPYLRGGEGKRIVNICSMGGRVGVPHMLPYDASKFALSGYSQGMMAELAPEGVSITTIYPALMRTGSPIQAVFKGDHEKEFAWFALADVLPLLSLSAESAANKIVAAARDRRVELMPSAAAKLRMIAASVVPELTASIMKAVASFMPTGHSGEYQTGEQSRALYDQMSGVEFLRKTEKKAERALNQSPKLDARFNMGLK